MSQPATIPTHVGPSSYFDPADVDDLDPATAALVRRRLRALGPAYRLFYEQPVQFSRGEGVHLYDVDDNEYLDCYNNVPAVGHAHPRVTAAITAQLSRLNTHTRYLHEAVVGYAEDLLATLPAELGQVMFTCTGSEAGDLALRIAKHQTGNAGVIVTRNAYHGVTTEIAAVSPSLGGIDSVAPWVRVIDAPDAYRVDHRRRGLRLPRRLVRGPGSVGRRRPRHARLRPRRAAHRLGPGLRRDPHRPRPGSSRRLWTRRDGRAGSTSRTRCRPASAAPALRCGGSSATV